MAEQIDMLPSLQEPSASKDTLPTVQSGMFCCAKFTEDNQWYRARITEYQEVKDTVQVIYVDFGNYELLPSSSLCPLKKEHAELPMGAVLCRLEGVQPVEGVSCILDKYR